MKQIWKYPFEKDWHFTIEMPVGAEIISAQDQGGQMCMWVIADPGNGLEMRQFAIAGTGHDMTDEMVEFIATIQMPPYVWHLFEVVASAPLD